MPAALARHSQVPSGWCFRALTDDAGKRPVTAITVRNGIAALLPP